MKLIVAVLKPFKLDDVKEVLKTQGVQVLLAVRYPLPHPYSIMFGSPKMPSNMPPMNPAMPWV